MTSIKLKEFNWTGQEEAVAELLLAEIWRVLPAGATLHYSPLFGIAKVGWGADAALVNIFHEAAPEMARRFVLATNPLDRWKFGQGGGASDEKIGGLIGCSRQAVSNIRLGSASPSAELRETMERELGIPVDSWPEPPNRQRKG